MNLRKILSVLLAVVMILSMVSIGAFAEESAVASISDVTYSSLQAAVDAAENGQIVKLLDNIQISNGYYDGEAIKVEAGKNIILDLNGKVLSQYVKDPGMSGVAVAVLAGAVLTVVDSSEEQTGKISACSTVVQLEGTLNLESGTLAVDATPSAYDGVSGQGWAYVVWVYMRSADAQVPEFNMTGGALKIGEVQMAAHSEHNWANAVVFGDAEAVTDMYKNAVVNISGGEIDGTLVVHEEAPVIVTGGTFADADVSAYVPSGYVQDETTGKVTESISKNVAEVNGVGYETLQGAIDIATDDPKATVKLIGDLEIAESVTISGAVNLDLNGYTLSNEHESSASYAMIYNNGTLVIDDTSESKEGKISFKELGEGDPGAGWGSYTIRNNGSLTINNGIIENISEQNVDQQSMKHVYFAIMNYSGDLTINNGIISTPSYRSIDFWGGSLTVNGGEFVGQVWVRPLASHAVIDINSGEFAPCWMDGSSVYITTCDGKNNYKGAEVEVSGGTFNGKIGCSTPSDIAGCITGGTFTENAKKGTNSALIASGFEFSQDENGAYIVSKKLSWTTVSDAGWYSVEGKTEKFGLMRFLFHINYEGEIAGSGIRYFSSNVTTEDVVAGKGGVTGEEKAFYGDIINVPESAKGNTYYALAYINIGTESNPEYIWSGALECRPNFEKEFNYTPVAGGNN